MAYTFKPITHIGERVYFYGSHDQMDPLADMSPCEQAHAGIINTSLEVTTEVYANEAWEYPGEERLTLTAEQFAAEFPSLPGYSEYPCDMWPYVMPEGDISEFTVVQLYSIVEATHQEYPFPCIFMITYERTRYALFNAATGAPVLMIPMIPVIAAGLLLSLGLISGAAAVSGGKRS